MLTRLETNHVSDSRSSFYTDAGSCALRRFRVELENLETGLHSRRGPAAQVRTVPARCTSLVLSEIKKAKLRFGLPADTPDVRATEDMLRAVEPRYDRDLSAEASKKLRGD